MCGDLLWRSLIFPFLYLTLSVISMGAETPFPALYTLKPAQCQALKGSLQKEWMNNWTHTWMNKWMKKWVLSGYPTQHKEWCGPRTTLQLERKNSKEKNTLIRQNSIYFKGRDSAMSNGEKTFTCTDRNRAIALFRLPGLSCCLRDP